MNGYRQPDDEGGDDFDDDDNDHRPLTREEWDRVDAFKNDMRYDLKGNKAMKKLLKQAMKEVLRELVKENFGAFSSWSVLKLLRSLLLFALGWALYFAITHSLWRLK